MAKRPNGGAWRICWARSSSSARRPICLQPTVRKVTLQSDVLTTLEAWVLSALLYPGLLFGVALAFAGEWLGGGVRSALTPRIYRAATAVRPQGFIQPLYNYLKLAGREPDPALLQVRDPEHASGSVSSLYK